MEKLQREKTRLSQMQDIAGCRIITETLAQQDGVVPDLAEMFKALPVDRRQRPSHGYRAVHVVVSEAGRFIEVQIRTSVQHTWAELSEKLADEFGHDIKYGGGSEELSTYLVTLSDAMCAFENALDSGNNDKILAESGRLFLVVEQLGVVINAERANQ